VKINLSVSLFLNPTTITTTQKADRRVWEELSSSGEDIEGVDREGEQLPFRDIHEVPRRERHRQGESLARGSGGSLVLPSKAKTKLVALFIVILFQHKEDFLMKTSPPPSSITPLSPCLYKQTTHSLLPSVSQSQSESIRKTQERLTSRLLLFFLSFLFILTITTATTYPFHIRIITYYYIHTDGRRCIISYQKCFQL